MKLRYCIRTCDARKEMASTLFDHLRDILPPKTQIDIINDYIGKSPITIFGLYLKEIVTKEMDFDYLVTLEDDAIVNDHLDYNLKSCQLLQDEDVGCLQLSISSLNDLKSQNTFFDREYKSFHRDAPIHYSCGLVFSKALLLHFQDANIIDEMINNKSVGTFDISMTRYCIEANMLCSLHYPALVASLPNVPSAMGNTYTPSDELFSKTWLNDKNNADYRKWDDKLKIHSVFSVKY